MALLGGSSLAACTDDDSSGRQPDAAVASTTSPDVGRDADPTPGTRPSQDATEPAPAGAEGAPAPLADDDAEVDADDQIGDGTTVRIDEVRLPSSAGHVVVLLDDGADVLGAQAIEATPADTEVIVDLDEPLEATTELEVVLYADDGDGIFDPATDAVVIDDDDDDDDDGDDDRVDDDLTYTVR